MSKINHIFQNLSVNKRIDIDIQIQKGVTNVKINNNNNFLLSLILLSLVIVRKFLK